jgi:hypothetical protein
VSANDNRGIENMRFVRVARPQLGP